MKTVTLDFCRAKWMLMVRILAGSLGLALLWALWCQLVFREDYPEAYILGAPAGRYDDFTDETLAASLPNPYVDPISFYPPSAFVFFRALGWSNHISLILVLFFSITALAYLLTRLLRRLFPAAWPRVALAFFFLALSYPLLFCIDRGNIEIVMGPLIAWALYCYSRQRDVAGTAILFPAICLKFYPAILLVLLLRRGKAGLAVACGVGAIIVNVACASFFQVPVATIWANYETNLAFFRDCYVLENSTLEGSGSLWNAYKIILLALQNCGLVPAINFGFDGPFILASYRVYSLLFAAIALGCALYAWLYETKRARGIIMLLLFISIAAPNGADYRLIYASMALAVLALIPQRRPGDWAALVLIAVAVVPKKELFLGFAGKTETDHADVPLQALLNPILLAVAMVILLYHARHVLRGRDISLRLRELVPWRWRWV